MSVPRRSLWVMMLLVCLATTVAADDQVTVARVFKLDHASAVETAQAILPLLSEQGAYTIEPRQRRITIQDRPEVMERVAEVIDLIDHPPERYRLLVELYSASNSGPEDEDDDPVDPVIRRMLRYRSYHRLGASVIEGEVGMPGGAVLDQHFQLRFIARPAHVASAPGEVGAPDGAVLALTTEGERENDAIHRLARRIQLHRLTLVQSSLAEGGTQRRTEEVLRTSIALSPGQRVVLGASASESADSALVLVVQSQQVETE